MTDAHAHDADAPHVHVMSMTKLVAVLIALLLLTWATVAVWYVDLGSANIAIALGIAVLKASLVALYFMHLRYDSLFNSVVLVGALLFVGLFIAVSLLDTHEYDATRQPFEQAPRIAAEAAKPAAAAGAAGGETNAADAPAAGTEGAAPAEAAPGH